MLLRKGARTSGRGRGVERIQLDKQPDEQVANPIH